MDLRTYQRKLAGLIKGDAPCPDDDAHLRRIAASDNLAVTREIILWWRQLSLERRCVLTSSALKQLGIFEAETRRFVDRWRFSPFVEELAEEFLTSLADHEIAVVASLARFERALIKVKLGAVGTVSIGWRHNPYAVFDALLNGGTLRGIKSEGRFTTVVSANLPGLFEVIGEQDATAVRTH